MPRKPGAPRSSSRERAECANRAETLADVLADRAAQLRRWATGEETPVAGVPTGIARLDASGLIERRVMTVIGGHTGDGKSVVRKQLTRGAASAGCRVQEYVLEDPRDFTADRILADEMDVDSLALRRLRVPDLEHRVEPAAGVIWARRVAVDFSSHDRASLLAAVRERWFGPDGEPTDLIQVDYAQRFLQDGEESVRALADDLADLARDSGCAVVLYSQVKQEVLSRGERRLESARWAANRAGRPLTPEEAVAGYRPGFGDFQWSTALQYRARSANSIFRPHKWARRCGFPVQDNIMDWTSDKENYGPDVHRITLAFDGPRSRIWDAGAERG